MIRPAELIERKRDGEELPAEELSELVLGYTRGEVPDYQMSAFLMAVYFRGLSGAETFALTDAMVASGETIDLGSALGRKVVDKHSTGGVGDKTSLAVGPIVAACGVPFGKMSGRGLGHTGGTLDKLESIPGFRVELTVEELIAQVREVGIAIIGQTGDLVPADKLLYALRDVTATVENVSLIAASIMSKKIAGGAEAIVLDVKVGDGAFMKTLDEARVLAETMIELGRRAGRETVCVLTDMDQPLGRAVGNALEVREALDTVRGDGPPDFTELVLDACAHLLALSDLGVDDAEGRRLAEEAVANGSAAEVWSRWIAAQGGDPDESALPEAGIVRPGHRAAGGPHRTAGSDRRRRSRSSSGRRPGIEGRRDRPRRRRRLPPQARRRRTGRRRARGSACRRRGICRGRRRRGARGVRDRRHATRGASARPRRPRLMALVVRRERPEDEREISDVVAAAFDDASVAAFTEAIRASAGYVPELTFVGEEDGRIAGYAMLSYVGLDGGPVNRLLILTPVAVQPDRQRQGVGAAVVRAAVAAADERGEPLVLVEGIPAYYPRFGFVSATALGLERPDERIPDQAWLALPLSAYDPDIRGRVVYPPFFPGPPDA